MYLVKSLNVCEFLRSYFLLVYRGRKIFWNLKSQIKTKNYTLGIFSTSSSIPEFKPVFASPFLQLSQLALMVRAMLVYI